jgi:hypothetical protein
MTCESQLGQPRFSRGEEALSPRAGGQQPTSAVPPGSYEEMDRARLAYAALWAGIVLTVVVWAVLAAMAVKLLF